MGIRVGLIGAHVMYVVHRFLPTTPSIDAALTVITPYLLFLAAEQFHFSGVMAVVTGGLFMSFRAHEVFRTGSTRLNMLGVWTTLIFVMNAMVFILIGLELPEIIQGLGEYSIIEAIKYGLIISVITILLRFLWVFPSAHFPRWLSAGVGQDPSPGWKGPLVISWAGMRGVVSLATALSIPLLMMDGSAFPQRNLIIFITFIVIFITLVLQGMTLPSLVNLISIKEIDQILPEEEQRAGIQLRLDNLALEILNLECQEQLKHNKMLQALKADLENKIASTVQHIGDMECAATQKKEIDFYQNIQLEINNQQRKELYLMRRKKRYSDEQLRKAELQLDLNELKITGTGR